MLAQAVQLSESPETSAQSAEPQHVREQVASLAYALWEQRGCPEGSPEEDWFRAEQELFVRPDR